MADLIEASNQSYPWSAEAEMAGYLREEVIDGDNHTFNLESK